MHPLVECKNFRTVKLPIVYEEDSKQKILCAKWKHFSQIEILFRITNTHWSKKLSMKENYF